jgi:hypothetical protein
MPPIVDAIEEMTGHPLTSLHFTTTSTDLLIRPADDWMDLSAYPDCSKPAEPEPGGPPDPSSIVEQSCSEVLAGEHVCLTTGAALSLMSLDDGAYCDVVSFDRSWVASSIAWSGEHVYACAGVDGMLQRVSLRDGRIEKAYVWCDRVATFDDGKLYVFHDGLYFGDAVPVYDTWEEVRCGAPSASAASGRNELIAIDGNILYSAWHSTDDYEWLDLTSGDEGTVELDRASDWVHGIDVTTDDWVVLTGRDETQWFTLEGERLGSIAFTGSGLACVSAASER